MVGLGLQSTSDQNYGSGSDSGITVEVVPHPNKIEVKDLPSANIVYLQLTKVTPCLKDQKDKKDRVTFFEQNVNIKSFVFDIPFTDAGKDHGGIKEQKLRRTYLRTRYAFPYIKSRVAVDGTF